MSSELREKVEAELAQLHAMLEPREPMVRRSLTEPVEIETLDALAALLHSFYTALERILLHVAKAEGELEGIKAKSETWHSSLLAAMTQPTGHRPPVVSDALRDQLAEYLGFRHVFRHAYVHQLDWNRMKPLVGGLLPTLNLFEGELRAYLKRREPS